MAGADIDEKSDLPNQSSSSSSSSSSPSSSSSSSSFVGAAIHEKSILTLVEMFDISEKLAFAALDLTKYDVSASVELLMDDRKRSKTRAKTRKTSQQTEKYKKLKDKDKQRLSEYVGELLTLFDVSPSVASLAIQRCSMNTNKAAWLLMDKNELKTLERDAKELDDDELGVSGQISSEIQCKV
eukprot:TRINITY_DN13296_c0_g1_i2.p1 TRINITY_DN13296_c0_g1~~TRINITY_DN13296_c0_g1_i2.p1  ORF type:complete len:183 (+),score=53.45 TRINITY_DN13296_c0_g1_i2:323-871(+)